MALREKNDAIIIKAGQWENFKNTLQKNKKTHNSWNIVTNRSVSDEAMRRIMKIAKEN